ncbi:MAG TPA: hypothetical protein VJU59_09165 [Paraburkholderia sp.]|uniref:hypothetical protein n=1 Tax=Paraburkholderia sp. TaxID=1926495 RepID=UPI002B462C06|nr:hypothetical protein [Paraburkholderia sp.]HKR39834.1 hypothetical protein [Paraburkholderia sp.]
MARPRHAKGKADRQARHQKPTAPTPPQQPIAAAETGHRWFDVFGSLIRTIKNHPVFTAITVLAALIGFAQRIDAVFDATFAAPEIHVTDSDPTSPFVFPFVLKNNGKVSMDDIEWVCIVQHMELPRGSTLDNVGFRSGGTQPSLAAGRPTNHVCNVINPGVPIRKVTMDVEVHYRTWHFRRRPARQRFSWVNDGDRSKWVEGDVN